jgi:NAD(P)-dependent dehydrogenase (short-subunit alcohol dehydrogenase family)
MHIYPELKDRVVLVTGGTQGIGEAMAHEFAVQKVKLAVNGRKINDRVQKVLDATGAFPALGDISDPTAAKRIVSEVVDKFGTIDALICNAAGMTMQPLLEQSQDDWGKQIDINLTGHIACIQEAMPHMLKQKRGVIVLISSFFGTLGWENASGYGASKSGLILLGQYLDREYRKHGISSCIIIPGVIRTPQLQVDADDLGVSLDEVCDIYAKDIPMNRVAQPKEIAATTVYMCTDAGGRAFSGRFAPVTGGAYRTTPHYV